MRSSAAQGDGLMFLILDRDAGFTATGADHPDPLFGHPSEEAASIRHPQEIACYNT
jgi:hypothetical protein